jgi:hypothetical protein
MARGSANALANLAYPASASLSHAGERGRIERTGLIEKQQRECALSASLPN